MKCEMKAENRLNDIMKPDEAVDIYEMMPRDEIESVNHMNESRNYCYEIVFQEINEVHNDS